MTPEGAITIWQSQVRTIKHYTEAMIKRRIEIDGVLFSWLVPFCTEIMNKYKNGTDGRKAYEKIACHECKHMVCGFAESVAFIFEPDKTKMHKGDSRVMRGAVQSIWSGTQTASSSAGRSDVELQKLRMIPTASTSSRFPTTSMYSRVPERLCG